MATQLDRAHDELERAEEHASSHVREQLQSIDEGVFEEESGVRTQDEPGPKDDRIAELEEKLRGLAERAEPPTQGHIESARDHLRSHRERSPEE